MADVTIEGKLLRWGNSYGIRIKKDDVEASDLQAGEEVVVRIEHLASRLELGELPTFRSGHAGTAERHDAALGDARSEQHVRAPGEPRGAESEQEESS